MNDSQHPKIIVALALLTQMFVLPATAATGANRTGQSPSATRIVSVGGAITEIIYALDGERHIVGVDTTSLWPDAAKKLPQVDYMRNLSAEGILSLSPTLLLASANAGPPKIIDQIREAGVPVKIIPDMFTVEGVCGKVLEIAEILHHRPEGEKLVAGIQSDFLRLEKIRSQLSSQPRVMFFMTLSQGIPLVSGKGTPADAMIQLAGGSNAITDHQGNKPVGSESIIAAAPDVILLTELTLNAVGGLEKFESVYIKIHK